MKTISFSKFHRPIKLTSKLASKWGKFVVLNIRRLPAAEKRLEKIVYYNNSVILLVRKLKNSISNTKETYDCMVVIFIELLSETQFVLQD